MVANLNNIQIILNEIPDSFIFEGVKTDNYKKSEEHYLHGWRDVVIPEINEFQRLGSEYFYDLENDVITKEVIDFTTDEIKAVKLNKAVSIDLHYTQLIDTVLSKHTQKWIRMQQSGEQYIIPAEKLLEVDGLREECNAKILALGITDFTYRKTIKGL